MRMLSPVEFLNFMKNKIKPVWKASFLTAFAAGILIHMPVLAADIPNHDGLDSLYFDQNMITSGRWFLAVACGFSSFYSIPWLIGILGLFFLACTAVVLAELLEVKDRFLAALVGLLLVSFPAIASTFAYVFTMDGYMLGMLFTVLSVFFTKEFPGKGFLPGAVCLAFGMGIYQAYLPFAIILSIYLILKDVMEGKITGQKIKNLLNYLFMGVLGVVLYYVILQVLLKVEGKALDAYQGIDGMNSLSIRNIPQMVGQAYRDFFVFTLRGKVLFQNGFSVAALFLLAFLAVFSLFVQGREKKCWKNPAGLIIMVVGILCVPFGMNVILFISPQVNYHVLMRYQWVLLPILFLVCAFQVKKSAMVQWGAVLASVALVFCYAVTDNIAYSNLQKKYEKTYAYCVRLLDRIEQADGYYPGVPVALIGVVGEEQFPRTNLTAPVTDNLTGMGGDWLLYTSPNYEKFIKYYLGATLNFVPVEKMGEIYYMDEYVEMESFPGKTSVKMIDGILCVKTENENRQ